MNNERAVIAGLLANPDRYRRGFHSDYFVDQTCLRIFDAIGEILKNYGDLQTINVELLTVFLNEEGNEGSYQEYFETPKTDFDADCIILQEAYVKRFYLHMGEAVSKIVSEGGPAHEIIEKVTAIKNTPATNIIYSSTNFTNLGRDLLAKVAEPGGDHISYKTGVQAVDQYHALYPGYIAVYAGRPSMGKTAFAISLAARFAHVANITYFSLEMSPSVMTARVVASVSRGTVPIGGIINHTLTNEQLDAMREVVENPIYGKINLECKSRTIDQIVSSLYLAHGKGICDIAVIDYLQLIQGNGDYVKQSRNLEISNILSRIKQFAVDTSVPVVLLSQLSRLCEQRDDKRPLLSDLRDSGSIEQDADVVHMLYSEMYYNREERTNAQFYDFEIATVKNRNGPVGTIHGSFRPQYGTFTF